MLTMQQKQKTKQKKQKTKNTSHENFFLILQRSSLLKQVSIISAER